MVSESNHTHMEPIDRPHFERKIDQFAVIVQGLAV